MNTSTLKISRLLNKADFKSSTEYNWFREKRHYFTANRETESEAFTGGEIELFPAPIAEEIIEEIVNRFPYHCDITLKYFVDAVLIKIENYDRKNKGLRRTAEHRELDRKLQEAFDEAYTDEKPMPKNLVDAAGLYYLELHKRGLLK